MAKQLPVLLGCSRLILVVANKIPGFMHKGKKELFRDFRVCFEEIFFKMFGCMARGEEKSEL